jgi:hypothetical protein
VFKKLSGTGGSYRPTMSKPNGAGWMFRCDCDEKGDRHSHGGAHVVVVGPLKIA